MKVPTEVKHQIDGMMENQYKSMKEGLIRNLGDTKLCILYFVLNNNKSNEAFAQFSNESFTTLSKSNFFRHVDELAYMDLFFVQRIRHGRSTILKFVENIGVENIKLVDDLVEKGYLIKNSGGDNEER